MCAVVPDGVEGNKKAFYFSAVALMAFVTVLVTVLFVYLGR